MPEQNAQNSPAAVYSPTARRLHWWTVALVATLLPLGFYMAYRGGTLNIWDGTTNALYSLHKALGFVLLWLVVARLAYRLRNGAPPDEPTLEPWQKAASHVTHWALYVLLILVPLGGWLGVSLYGARGIVGPIALPPIAPVDQALSEQVFMLHKLGAMAIAGLVAVHIGAALYHHLIRKDGVLRRMLPGIGAKRAR